MHTHPTARTKTLGYYVQFKGVAWALIGLVLWWAATISPEFWKESSLRLFAYFLLVFAIPGVLVWTLGVLVKYRHPMGWYGAVLFLIGNVVFKIGGGIAELPLEAWHWVSQRIAPEYLTELKVFGFLAMVVFAMDIAALLAFLSPRGRDCYYVGKRNPDARL